MGAGWVRSLMVGALGVGLVGLGAIPAAAAGVSADVSITCVDGHPQLSVTNGVGATTWGFASSSGGASAAYLPIDAELGVFDRTVRVFNVDGPAGAFDNTYDVPNCAANPAGVFEVWSADASSQPGSPEVTVQVAYDYRAGVTPSPVTVQVVGYESREAAWSGQFDPVEPVGVGLATYPVAVGVLPPGDYDVVITHPGQAEVSSYPFSVDADGVMWLTYAIGEPYCAHGAPVLDVWLDNDTVNAIWFEEFLNGEQVGAGEAAPDEGVGGGHDDPPGLGVYPLLPGEAFEYQLRSGDVTVVASASGVAPTCPTEAPFVDVPLAGSFSPQVAWLADRGITGGYADGGFHPSAAVSRQAMAAFLYRFAGSPAFTAPVVSPFTDVSTDSGFYKEICWLADAGITGGYADGGFHPTAGVSRQAMAAFLYRFAGQPAYSPPVASAFVDVSVDSAFFAEVSWLASTGISTGTQTDEGTVFKPTDPVSRQAMAAFLFRFYDQGRLKG